MEETKANEIAAELYNWGQTAIFDMCGDEMTADEQWEDAGALRDIFGDRIFDQAMLYDPDRYAMPLIEICEAMKRTAPYHKALHKAMDEMITWHTPKA
jgi:hypothetical protein